MAPDLLSSLIVVGLDRLHQLVHGGAVVGLDLGDEIFINFGHHIRIRCFRKSNLIRNIFCFVIAKG